MLRRFLIWFGYRYEHPLLMADLVNSLGLVRKSGIAVVLGD